MRVFVVAFLLLSATGFAPASQFSPVPVPPAAAAVGPVSTPETDPRILAIRSLQQEAMARGDRAELKRLEGQVQTILLAQQPRPRRSDLQFTVVKPDAGRPAYLGPDAVIDTGYFYATGADYMMDGTMYAAAFRVNDTTNWFYRSTDHGQTWQTLPGVDFSSGGQRVMTQRLALCVGGADSAFLYMFVCLKPPFEDLYLWRANLDGTDGQMYNVYVNSDTVSDLTACRDYSGADYWLYVVAVNDQRVASYNARYLRSTDYGKTWVVTDSGGSDLHPHYSFGAGSWLYHALEGPDAFAKGQVWLFYNPLYGAHGQWQFQTVQADTFHVREPAIAPAFTLPESSAAVWSVFSHNHNGTGDMEMLYAASADGGQSWPYIGTLASDSGVREQYGDVRNFTSRGNTYINASYISEAAVQRTVYRHYASSSDPLNWSDTLRINSNSAGTGYATRPLLVYSPGGPGTGAGCVFVGAGLRNLYFNSPWPAALSEAGGSRPRQASQTRFCREALEWTGSSPARLFDVSGRPAVLLRPGQNDLRRLASGVYQIREAGGQVLQRIVITR